MTEMLIVGASGFGREIFEQAKDDYAHNKDWKIVGFLDGRADLQEKYQLPLPIVGDPLTYQLLPNQQLIMGLADALDKIKYSENLLKQGGHFINLCTSMHRASDLRMGHGNIFGLGVHLSVGCVLEDFISIQASSMVGHDVHIQSYCHIGAQCFIGGGAQLGKGVTIHPNATIAAGAKIGDFVTVGPGSVVFGKIPANATVLGNPARRFDFAKNNEI